MDTNIMACRCGGGSPRKRLTDYLPPKTQAAKGLTTVVTVAPAGPPVFCNKCGWVVKTVKYVDRQTRGIAEKTTCTNTQCPDHI